MPLCCQNRVCDSGNCVFASQGRSAKVLGVRADKTIPAAKNAGGLGIPEKARRRYVRVNVAAGNESCKIEGCLATTGNLAASIAQPRIRIRSSRRPRYTENQRESPKGEVERVAGNASSDLR
jgi:hypothetical protein